jgi:hypothetical protein
MFEFLLETIGAFASKLDAALGVVDVGDRESQLDGKLQLLAWPETTGPEADATNGAPFEPRRHAA